MLAQEQQVFGSGAYLFLRGKAHRQLAAVVVGHRPMNFLYMPAEGSAQRRLYVERKGMIAGRTTLGCALLD